MGLVAGLALLLLIVGSFAGCERHNANEARADRDAMKSQRDSARNDRDQVVEANGTQQTIIDRQGAALTKWASIGVTPEDVKAMLDATVAKKAELEQQLVYNAKRKEKDDANPDCEKLRRTDFQRACPNRADILRRYEDRVSRQGSAR